PVQQDIKSPTLLHRAASFESTNEEDFQDAPVSPGVKRNFSDTSLSSKDESSTVKENFAAGKDILRRVTLRPSSKPNRLTRRTSTNEAPTTANSVSGVDNTALRERSGSLIGENKDKPRQDSTPQIVVRPSKSRAVS